MEYDYFAPVMWFSLLKAGLGSNLNQPGVVENPVDFGRPKNDVNGHGNGTLTLGMMYFLF